MDKVKLDLEFRGNHIAGEFDPHTAKLLINSLIPNGNGTNEIPTPEPEIKPQPEKREFIPRRKLRHSELNARIRSFFENATKDFIPIDDYVKYAGLEAPQYIGGNGYRKLARAAKKSGYEKIYGGFQKIHKEEHIAKSLKYHGHKYDSLFDGREFIKTGDAAKFLNAKKTNNIGGKRFHNLNETAERHGYTKIKGGWKLTIKHKVIPAEKDHPYPYKEKRTGAMIPASAIHNAIFYVGKSLTQFKISDVLKALKTQPCNTTNPEYLRVYIELENLKRRRAIEKTSFIVDKRKFNYYKTLSKAEKEEEAQEKIQLPDDTTDEIITRIFDNYLSFDWAELMGVKNKHGQNYGKWSAKGLFKWIWDNPDYVKNLTKKNMRKDGDSEDGSIKVISNF
jgi:hypothetical protein